jgi:hypothetical protein
MDVSQDWQLIIRYRCPQCGKRYVVAEWKENPKCRAESRSSPATQATVRSTQHSNPAKLITRAFHLQQKKPVRPFRRCIVLTWPDLCERLATPSCGFKGLCSLDEV